MNRKFLILICLILFIISIAGVAAAEDVNQTTDDALSVSTDNEIITKDAGTFTALQEKINSAAEGSTINLENDYKYDEGFDKEGISINKDLTIEAKGYKIDGNNNARIFNIGGNVVLKNIILQNAKIDDDDGGAILVKGNPMNCINCTFINNTALGGGAISAVHGADISLRECTFINNDVPDSGNYAGGAVYIYYADAEITDCIFESNSAVRGGAIYAAGDDASISVEKSEFINNVAYNYGGAIFWNCRGNVTDCQFTKNTALNHRGDSIYLSINHNKILKNCNFINKYSSDDAIYFPISYVASELTLSNLNFKDNLNDYGGLISVKDNTLTFGGVDKVAPTKNVIVSIAGKTYEESLKPTGSVDIDLSDLPGGVHDARICYDNSLIINLPIAIPSPIKLDGPDVTKYYKGSERFVVTVKEDNKPVVGKDVTINLNGKPYTKTTDNNGQASMAINLNSGTYKVTSEFEGIKVDSTITVKSTVSGKDVTKIFRNGTQYYATFVDTKGNLIKNTDVKFNINGVYYTRTTNGEGVARMNINLPPGTYIITAENPDSTEMYTNVIKVLPSIVENHDLTKYYRNESKYTLRIIGDDGKPVGEGVAVKLNINGVFYERKTDASGYMSMNINLPPGTYTVTTEYNALMASNTIKVLSVLETKDLLMSYRDGFRFEAKVLDGKGKPYAGQTVTFNINGVFYQRTTGDDGIARLSINLMAGEYIITSTYNGLNAANRVTIRS